MEIILLTIIAALLAARFVQAHYHHKEIEQYLIDIGTMLGDMLSAILDEVRKDDHE